MKRILITNEIATALLNSEISEYEKSLLEANPKNFLFTLLKMDFEDDINIKVLCNNDKMIHLALPYYNELDSKAHAVGESELQDAIGGIMKSNEESKITKCGAQGFITANRQFSDDDTTEIAK